ncbi:MAG: response regulator [Candidatus Omnitrophota bacterium]
MEKNQLILLVEDEECVLAVMKSMLRHLKCDYIEAKTGHEALRQIYEREDDISLIILDYKLPGMDGIQCLQHIRRVSKKPVIMTSGESIPQEVTKHIGAQGFLAKPFSIGNMEDELIRLLHKKEKDSKPL